MDSLLATGSPLSSPLSGPTPLLPENGIAAPAPTPTYVSTMDLDLEAALEAVKTGDPAAQQQAMRHFVSHIDADCFVSLLQTMDPMPEDSRARAEYRRFYRELREVLTVPAQSLDPGDAGSATDPVE